VRVKLPGVLADVSFDAAATAGKADADGHSSTEVVGNKTEGALLMMVEAAGESPQQLKESSLHLDKGDKVCITSITDTTASTAGTFFATTVHRKRSAVQS
jgi:Cation transport ATPase (P-type)